MRTVVVLLLAIYVEGLDNNGEKRRVHSLPGFDGLLPSRLFSGYIPIADNTRHMHYWFVESEGDPAKDPVILWMQGGPGASSALGMFVELGPYSFSDASVKDSDDSLLPTPQLNPYSWTKVGSLIFIESPCGVGFSYCDSGECPSYNDTTAADDNLEFVKGFFERFEEYRQNDFYIAGESYGGIYVPMLAERVSERPDLFNLKGIAVGNGCIGAGVVVGRCGVDEAFWSLKTLYNHGQYSTETYESLMSNCETSLRDGTWLSGDNKLCELLTEKAIHEAGRYCTTQLYDECEAETSGLFASTWWWSSTSSMSSRLRQLGAVNNYSCGAANAMGAWLNLVEVKEALHVKQDIFWHAFAPTLDNYSRSTADVKPVYKRLVDTPLRVLVYFGDTDTSVPMRGGEYWTRRLGLKVIESWRPWTLDGNTQVAGHIVRYEKGFDFVTIRGAGHMVPQFKPRAALVMISKWIANCTLPTNIPLPDVDSVFHVNTPLVGDV